MSFVTRPLTVAALIMAVLAMGVIAANAEEKTAEEADGSAAVSDDMRLPGDNIRLKFWREPELSGDYQVDETGTVVLPILGPRKVTGIEAAELKRQLQEEYARHIRDGAVQITLLQRVRILGEVKAPGVYQLDPTMSMGDAIAMASGLTNESKENDIRILRKGEEIHSHLHSGVDVNEYVRSGDQIRVPRKSWFSRHAAQFITTLIAAAAVLTI